ncbi:hypothetical protein AB7M17_008224 [Bradyrhizobium sp. USDA 377]
MKYLGLALAALFTVPISGAGHTAEPTRFVPLKAEELTSPQKEWADAIAAGLDPAVAKDIANGVRPQTMKDDEAALYELAMALYRDKKVSDEVYRAAQQKFGERGIMDIIGLIGYYDLVSMTLITMQAEAPNDSVPPLPPLAAK